MATIKELRARFESFSNGHESKTHSKLVQKFLSGKPEANAASDTIGDDGQTDKPSEQPSQNDTLMPVKTLLASYTLGNGKNRKSIQPVIKNNVIGDPSSDEEDEVDPFEDYKKSIKDCKPATIGGNVDPKYRGDPNRKLVQKPGKAIIGDDSDDEGKKAFKNDPHNGNSDGSSMPPLPEVTDEFQNKLLSIMKDKMAIREHELKEREEHLKKYHEEYNPEDKDKLADSDDESDPKEKITNEELWAKFTHADDVPKDTNEGKSKDAEMSQDQESSDKPAADLLQTDDTPDPTND